MTLTLTLPAVRAWIHPDGGAEAYPHSTFVPFGPFIPFIRRHQISFPSLINPHSDSPRKYLHLQPHLISAHLTSPHLTSPLTRSVRISPLFHPRVLLLCSAFSFSRFPFPSQKKVAPCPFPATSSENEARMRTEWESVPPAGSAASSRCRAGLDGYMDGQQNTPCVHVLPVWHKLVQYHQLHQYYGAAGCTD